MHWSLLTSLGIRGNTKLDDDFLDIDSRRLGVYPSLISPNHRPDCREKQTQPATSSSSSGFCQVDRMICAQFGRRDVSTSCIVARFKVVLERGELDPEHRDCTALAPRVSQQLQLLACHDKYNARKRPWQIDGKRVKRWPS
jgi:hypothetical protein